jgi:hypothetical protein
MAIIQESGPGSELLSLTAASMHSPIFRSLTECLQLFRTVLHFSQICGLLHFPESDWTERWGIIPDSGPRVRDVSSLASPRPQCILHFPESDWTEWWGIIPDSGPRVRDVSSLASPRPQCILHFPESDRVLAIIPDCATFVQDLWLSPFSESDWTEWWGNYSGLWSTCPRLVGWPRRILCAFSTLTSAMLGTRCTLFLQDSNSSPSSTRNQFKTSVADPSKFRIRSQKERKWFTKIEIPIFQVLMGGMFSLKG